LLQIPGGIVPPILSGLCAALPRTTLYRHLSRRRSDRRVVACWVLPSFARTRCDEIALYSATLSPCSQLHARLAGCIAAPAGGLLPHPFTPYHAARQPAGMLSVAVV